MKFQKLTAGLLALSMLCTPAAGAVQMLTAAAEEAAPTSGTCGESVTWVFDESTGTLTISGTGEMEDYWGNKSPWSYRNDILTIVIEDGITSIGDEAFMFCTSLTSVTIPDSVTSIGDNAFCDTPWLTAKKEEDPLVVVNGILIDGKTCSGDVTIPDSVTSIGDGAFYHCYSLTSVTIPDSVTSIGDAAFYFCTSLTSVTIPDSVTSIGNWTFYYCKSLTDITIPDGVTSIGDNAFLYCTSLTSVTIPDSVTSIGEDAFSVCTNLTEITIPDSVTSIGGWAFSECTSLTDITILNPDCEIYDGSGTIFNGLGDDGNAIFTGTIHGYANSTAQSYAEKYDRKFESLGDAPDTPDVPTSGTCGESVTWVFDKSTGTLTISGTGEMEDYNLKYKAPWYSNYYDAIKSIIIEDGITSIGEDAFSECTSLTEITILNPDCEIYDGSRTISNGWDDDNVFFAGTIHGYANSTAQAYAEKYGYTFASLGDAPEAPALILGDVSGDGGVDASDAADLLFALAKLGVGENSGLTADQQKAADTNGDGSLDAGDAATILQYATYLGSGGTGTLADFLKN